MPDYLMLAPSTPAAAPVADVDAGARARILLVDDEEIARRPIALFFTRRGYDVRVAATAEEALRILRDETCAAMITDVRMPGMSGLDMLPEALAIDPDLAVLMISGLDDAVSATVALQHGAYDYLVKPLDLPSLVTAVEKAIHKRDLRIRQRQVEDRIREEVHARTSEAEQEKSALRLMTVRVAEALITAMEAKIPLLMNHSHRVGESAASIAEEMGLDPDLVELIRQAGHLHDVGKIGVPEALLESTEGLTPDEVRRVREHVRIGLEIIAPLPHLAEVGRMIQDHHEHWDGSGYPRGLKGDAIALGGRIIRAADALDWLTATRPHRRALSRSDAVLALEFYSGRALDPDVYAALRRAYSRRTQIVFLE